MAALTVVVIPRLRWFLVLLEPPLLLEQPLLLEFVAPLNLWSTAVDLPDSRLLLS